MKTRRQNNNAKEDTAQLQDQAATSHSLETQNDAERRNVLSSVTKYSEDDVQKSPTKAIQPAKRKGIRKSKWDRDTVLVDPKSPLASINLRKLIANPLAWDALDPEQQREIAALFPDQGHIIGDPNSPRLDYQSLMNDDGFHDSCQSYVNDLADGRHDTAWLASAWEANERRRAGDFDEYLSKKFETDWDTTLPVTKASPIIPKLDNNTDSIPALTDNPVET